MRTEFGKPIARTLDVRLEIRIDNDGNGSLVALPNHVVDSENPRVEVELTSINSPIFHDERWMSRNLLHQLAEAIAGDDDGYRDRWR